MTEGGESEKESTSFVTKMFPSLAPLIIKSGQYSSSNTTNSAQGSQQRSIISEIQNNKPSWNFRNNEKNENPQHGEDALLFSIETNHDDVKTKERSRTLFPASSKLPSNAQGANSQAKPLLRKSSSGQDNFDLKGAFGESEEPRFFELYKFIDFLRPKLRKRSHWYAAACLFMAIILTTQRFRETGAWILLLIVTIGLDLITFLIDELFFCFVVDRIFIDHYDVAYLLHSLNGPFGLAIMLVVVEIYFSNFRATELFPSYNDFISSVTIVLICLCVKQFYSRKHYIQLLEKRFAERLFKLETYNILLSELATVHPPKRFYQLFGKNYGSWNRSLNNKNNSNNNQVSTSTLRNVASLPNMLGESITVQKAMKTVRGVFEDIVQATAMNNADQLHNVRTPRNLKPRTPVSASRAGRTFSISSERDGKKNDTNSAVKVPQNDMDEEEIKKAEKLEELADIRQRKTFWQSASKLSANAGMLRIQTYNGMVFIRKRSQAKDFGKTLYKHLSRRGKLIITPKVIEALLFEMHHPETAPRRPSIDPQPGDIHVRQDIGNCDNGGDVETGFRGGDYKQDYSAVSNSVGVGGGVYVLNNGYTESPLPPLSLSLEPPKVEYTDEQKEHDLLFYTTAMELFDPFKTEVITEQQIVDGLLLIYKEQRFAASSLNDYGEIHQSLHNVINFFFWAIMTVVLQIFLKLDITAFILPFITLMLTVSFALGPLVGNIFLACTFVFFMLPFDIGNRVVLGVDANKLTVYVRGVSLLYTTFITNDNKIVKIPNHLLFHEKIFNLVESSGMVFQFDVHFNITDYSGGKDSTNATVSDALSPPPAPVATAPLPRPVVLHSQSDPTLDGNAPTMDGDDNNGRKPTIVPPLPPPLPRVSLSQPTLATSTAATLSAKSVFAAPKKNQAKITQFVEQLLHWMTVENREEWASASFYCSNIDTVNNSIVYSMWATHRDNWANIRKPLASRTKLLMKIRELQIEMGLVFVKIPQAVSLSFPHSQGDDTQNHLNDGFDGFDETERMLRELALASKNVMRHRVGAGFSNIGTSSSNQQQSTVDDGDNDDEECGDDDDDYVEDDNRNIKAKSNSVSASKRGKEAKAQQQTRQQLQQNNKTKKPTAGMSSFMRGKKVMLGKSKVK